MTRKHKEKEEEKNERWDNISCNVGEVVAMQVAIATTSIGVVAFLIVNEIANFGAITPSHRKQGN